MPVLQSGIPEEFEPGCCWYASAPAVVVVVFGVRAREAWGGVVPEVAAHVGVDVEFAAAVGPGTSEGCGGWSAC